MCYEEGLEHGCFGHSKMEKVESGDTHEMFGGVPLDQPLVGLDQTFDNSVFTISCASSSGYHYLYQGFEP